MSSAVKTTAVRQIGQPRVFTLSGPQPWIQPRRFIVTGDGVATIVQPGAVHREAPKYGIAVLCDHTGGLSRPIGIRFCIAGRIDPGFLSDAPPRAACDYRAVPARRRIALSLHPVIEPSAKTRMKPSSLATYALFPAAFLLGILAGGVVYSHVAFFPAYLADLPHSSVVVTGKYGINEAPFWLALHPLLILSLLAALVLNWKIAPRRRLIALSLGIYVAVLGASALYFIPELFAFAESAGSSLPDSAWADRGRRWLTLSHIRGAFCLLAFLAILAALANPTGIPAGRDPGPGKRA